MKHKQIRISIENALNLECLQYTTYATLPIKKNYKRSTEYLKLIHYQHSFSVSR